MQTARFLRASKAHAYLGMCRAVFDRDVRPFITEIPIGARGIAFDRLELDRWADQYKQSKGKNSTKPMEETQKTWQRKVSQGSSSVVAYGTLTSRSRDLDAFAAARARATTQKRRRS